MWDDVAAWISAIIALAALGVAIVALVKSNRAQAAGLTLQRRMVVIEEERDQASAARSKQAILSARSAKTDRGGVRLVVRNDGHAEARNLRVELDGKPMSEHPTLVKGNDLCGVIGPRSEVSAVLGVHFGCSPPFDLAIVWDDDSGVARTYRTTLTW